MCFNLKVWMSELLINSMVRMYSRVLHSPPLETITTSGETRTVAMDTLFHITAMSTLFLAFIAILSIGTTYHNPKIVPVIRFHILQMVRY